MFMVKKLYHGSSEIIEKPLFGYGKAYNDYGLGFYCTYSLEMAKEWGVSRDHNGYANCYEIECNGLRILDLGAPEYCILHWLSILLQNREFDIPSSLALEAKEYLMTNFAIDYENWDASIGYRADDSYFSFAQDFINGTISYRQLSNAMHLGKLGEQFVLKSKRAFDRIRYIGSELAESNEWYAKKALRDKTARLIFLDAELNLDARGKSEQEQVIPKSSRPSILSRLKTPTSQGSSPKQKKHHEEVR